jgi:ribulose-5-phosphate 4-epimerase/fuculose-1-phosphate aldolase
VFRPDDFDPALAEQICRYGQYLTARGWVHNTLGNIAVRSRHGHDPQHGVLYTKHLGVSLQEMSPANVIVTDILSSELLFGVAKA